MPKTPQLFRDIREQRRKEIKQVSLELFADKGFSHTSVSEIAKSIGISKGLIYNYFDSKQNILAEIVIDFVQMSYKFFDSNQDGVLTEEEFFYFLQKNFSLIKENPQHWKLYFMIFLQNDVMKIMQEKLEVISTKTGKILNDFFSENFGDKSCDEMVFLTSFMKGAILQFVVTKDQKMFDVAEKLIVEHFKQKLT